MLKTTNFDFYGKRKIFFGISIGMVVLVIIMLFVNGVSLDIQFKGGSIIEYNIDAEYNYESASFLLEVEDVAEQVLNAPVYVQEKSDISIATNKIVLNIAGSQGLTSEKQQELLSALNAAFPGANLEVAESLNVDPFYGAEFFRNGILAIILAAVLITLYVWFRFRTIHGLPAGVMALLALLHDVIVVFAVYVIFKIPINDSFVAVVLTMLGYSINDTIVIYDRIRENEKIYGSKMPVVEMANLSLNQTLTRTINVSFAVFMSIATVYIVAVITNLSSIIEFALPMLAGVISGCYSTLFLAVPLWASYTIAKDKKQEKAKELARGVKQKAKSTTQAEQGAKQKEKSVKQEVQSVKQEAQDTKQKTQGAKQKTQNTKKKAKSKKRK